MNGKQCLTAGSESLLNFLFKSLATQITQLFDVDCNVWLLLKSS